MSSGWLYFEIGLHLVAVIGAGGGDPLPTDVLSSQKTTHRPKVIILGRPSTFLIGELTRYVVHHPHRALVKT